MIMRILFVFLVSLGGMSAAAAQTHHRPHHAMQNDAADKALDAKIKSICRGC
jgi:hypothetical protein